MNQLIKKLQSEEYWEEIEFQRYGIMPISITAQSCLGSIAVGYLLAMQNMDHLVFVSIVAMVTMCANAIVIAQQPMKLVLGSFVISMLVSFILLLMALIVG